MTERKPAGTSFETWVDQQIAQALERGAFEGLAGRPLPRRDREQSSYEWALEWARRENGGTEGMLPPGLALRKEREELPAAVERSTSESAVRALVEDFNDRVAAHWRRPADRADAVPGMADLDALLEHWRATRPPVPEVVPPVEEVPVRRRRRWFPRSLRRSWVGTGPRAKEVPMTEVPGTDRNQAGENVLHETPLVPESVEDADDDPRSTDHPTHRGDDGQTGDSVKPPAGSTHLDT